MVFTVGIVWVMIVVVVNMVVIFLRWKLSTKKIPKFSRELIFEGLTTLDQAKGV